MYHIEIIENIISIVDNIIFGTGKRVILPNHFPEMPIYLRYSLRMQQVAKFRFHYSAFSKLLSTKKGKVFKTD